MTFPYGVPSEATYAQCDALIVDLVRAINADDVYHLKTVQSCEGHPWPMLELVGERNLLALVTERMLFALPEKVVLSVVVVVRPYDFPQEGVSASERWRFTVIPTRNDPGAVAEARAVLAAPWS